MPIKLTRTIQTQIEVVEARMRAQFSNNPATLVDTLENLIFAGGKRIRPTLILLTGNMFNAQADILVDLAAAIEMMHAATLIHDDLVDNAAQRRGHPTINTRFSTSATVLAGDLTFAAAAQLGAATQSITVMQRFSETLQTIVNGEITYMFKDSDNKNLQDYYNWIYAKTASVFELGSEMAATIGDANPAEIEAARQFGYQIGMAFQVTDDILDFVGDPAVLGKPAGNDLRQGTLTLPTLLYSAAHPEALNMRAIQQSNGNGQGYVEDIIRSIRQSDAISQAQQIADQFLQDGLAALGQLPDTPERAELARLSKQLATRNF